VEKSVGGVGWGHGREAPPTEAEGRGLATCRALYGPVGWLGT